MATTNNDDLLFVEHALKRGLVTDSQVDEIMRIQERVREMGVPDSIPALMVKRGVLKADETERVLAEVRPKARKEQIPGFRLLRRLGHGGMGSVYLARQVAMDRLVALKVLKPSLTKDPHQVERLHREAQLVGKLNHPNIVGGLDRGEAGGFHYFAMEYIEGETLKDRLKPGRPMGETEALKVVRSVAEALDHAWSHRITHRDIKPGNILLRSDGSACVMDYGLAKGPLDVSITVTGTTLGTPQYLSPEQARNPRDVDIRTDLYALGATLFHMLTGRPAFKGENLAEVVTQVLMKPHDPPQSLNPRITRNSAFLIDKLMAKDSKNRHATPRELIRDLDAIDRGRSIVPAGWEGDWKTFVLRRRMKRFVLGTVTVVVLGFALFAYGWWESKQDRLRLRQETAASAYAALFKDDVTFEGIDERVLALTGLVETFDDIEPRFRKELDFWRPILAVRDRILEAEETCEGHLARFDFASCRDELLKLRDAVSVHRVVEEHLRAELIALERQARERARERLGTVDEGPYVGYPEYTAALEGLRADLDARWPAEWVPQDAVRAKLELRLAAARKLGEVADSLAALVKDEIEGHLEDHRYREAEDVLTGWENGLNADELATEALEALKDTGAGTLLDLRVEKVRNRTDKHDFEARRGFEVTYEVLLEASNDPEEFDGAIEMLEARGKHALRDSVPRLQELRRRLEKERESRRRAAVDAFERRTEPNFRALLRGGVESAARLLTDLEGEMDGEGRPYEPWIRMELLVAREDLGYVETYWVRFREGLSERIGRPGSSFRKKGGVGVGPVTFVSIDATTLEYLPAGAGASMRVSLRDIKVENALEHAGLAGPGLPAGGEERKTAEDEAAVIRFLLVPQEHEDLRLERERLQGLLDAILEPRSRRYRGEVGARSRALYLEQQQREHKAEKLYDEAEASFEKGDWQNARRGFEDLDSLDQYKHTDLYDGNKHYIQSYIERCKTRMMDDKLSLGFKGGQLRLRDPGARVLSNQARASITWSLDEEGAIEDLGLTEEHAKIAIVPGPDPDEVLGPPGPEGGPPVVRSERRVLALLQGETPDEYLQRHPIEIVNPFRVNDRMSLAVDVRSPVPVFLAISLGGYVCAILSQEDRVEGGTGVVFLATRDLDELDEHPALQALRHPRRRKELENPGNSPIERMGLERTRYFGMKPDRWYRLRFVKGERRATLRVDGRLVGKWDVPRSLSPDRGRIVLLTYTTTLLDNLRIEGTLDSLWVRGRGL